MGRFKRFAKKYIRVSVDAQFFVSFAKGKPVTGRYERGWNEHFVCLLCLSHTTSGNKIGDPREHWESLHSDIDCEEDSTITDDYEKFACEHYRFVYDQVKFHVIFVDGEVDVGEVDKDVFDWLAFNEGISCDVCTIEDIGDPEDHFYENHYTGDRACILCKFGAGIMCLYNKPKFEVLDKKSKMCKSWRPKQVT